MIDLEGTRTGYVDARLQNVHLGKDTGIAFLLSPVGAP
jgi:hypothetical protein